MAHTVNLVPFNDMWFRSLLLGLRVEELVYLCDRHRNRVLGQETLWSINDYPSKLNFFLIILSLLEFNPHENNWFHSKNICYEWGNVRTFGNAGGLIALKVTPVRVTVTIRGAVWSLIPYMELKVVLPLGLLGSGLLTWNQLPFSWMGYVKAMWYINGKGETKTVVLQGCISLHARYTSL